MQRVMLFVDGSNVIGSLSKMNLRVDDYESFYRYVFERAVDLQKARFVGLAPTAALVRILWYAVGSLDQWDLNDPRVQASLHEAFQKDKDLKRTYMASAGVKLQAVNDQVAVAREAWAICYAEIRSWYERRHASIDGFRRFYHAIRNTTDYIDIIECGHWKLNILGRSVEEKGLDTRLAVDMVTLDNSYDLAVLVSGDADHIPSIEYLKRLGKHVALVEFLGGYPPEKRGAQTASRLRVSADFVVQIYEMELVQKSLARVM